MKVERIGGTCACIVGAAMVWCASAQAQADVATGSTGGPVAVHAVEIELHGAGDRGTITGAPYAAEAVSEVVQTLAEGTRSTMTIAAGQIGNERPIEIVSERWFSPELKALVLSTQIDPRFGETTYRLSNIVRGDPDAALFEIPADYQVIEAGGAGDVIFRRRLP